MQNLKCLLYPDFSFNRRPCAAATVKGSEKYPDISGRVLFYKLDCGVIVRAEICGLPSCKENGIFAFHIHAGNCGGQSESEPFPQSQGHYNPQEKPHPYHAGDMPPMFSTKGAAFLAFYTDRFKISEVIGKAIILHAAADDFTTQPSGNASEKIACGEIRPVCFRQLRKGSGGCGQCRG